METAWGVLCYWQDSKRGEWLTPSSGLTSRRVHASLNYGAEGKARCERVAADLTANDPNITRAVARAL